MILVDSCVWIDLLRDRRTSETERLSAAIWADADVGSPDLVVAEVLRGSSSDRRFELHRRILLGFPVVRIADPDTAVATAANYRRLRAAGVTVAGMIDGLIATRCIRDGHRLLTSDRDFAPFVQHLGLQLA